MLTQSNELDFSGQNFYCGNDIHKKNWAVTIETDGVSLKTFVQEADPDQLVRYLKRNYPGGRYIAAYEAGYLGFTTHRKLKERVLSIQYNFKKLNLTVSIRRGTSCSDGPLGLTYAPKKSYLVNPSFLRSIGGNKNPDYR